MRGLFKRNFSISSSFFLNSFFSKGLIFILPLIGVFALYVQHLAFEQKKMLFEQKLLLLQMESNIKLGQSATQGANSIILDTSSNSHYFGILIFVIGIVVVGMLIQNSDLSGVLEKSALHAPKMLKEQAQILGDLTDAQTKTLLDHNTFLAQKNIEVLQTISNQIARLESLNGCPSNLDFELANAAEQFYNAAAPVLPLIGFR